MAEKSQAETSQGDFPVDEATAARLGASLRALRKQNGWTLSDVSERTGLSVSTLSKVENDKLSLTYDKLVRLSRGLSVDIARLFTPAAAPQTDAPPPSGRRSINYGGQGRSIETHTYGHQYLAADLLNKQFVPIIAEIRARNLDAFLEEFGELIRHPGEEFAFVLEGEVELHTELYAPLRLKTGDSIYFDSGMGHAYINAGTERCRVLSICSSAEARIIEKFQRDTPPADGAEATPRPTAPRTTKRPQKRRGKG